ncbi:peptidase c26 [Lucifera butyrica]|uniref:Peptidase c26 n=1 Tax=Lucifera butyrica TaxID=1351585 RepID=A0A498R638_9FIRM|nr:gamma-glutamyl-gamma-aminobutyrate hydrolase family protein [Lucifera butyrica]VBB06629.1 peptidase c26 [Lucifera butyrica]
MTENKPVIGITASPMMVEGGILAGSERSCVGRDYIRAVTRAGGIPIIIPAVNDADTLDKQVAMCQGILLSGGGDIHPSFYGEEPVGPLGFVSLERDEYEIKVVQAAKAAGKPLLGICRGVQLLNVAFGGTLYQDISWVKGNRLEHNQNCPGNAAWHTVTIAAGSRLHAMMGVERIMTNSSHHQIIKGVAPGFLINARTKDGVIEGIEKDDSLWIVGVQWHPERLVEQSPAMQNIFDHFVAAAGKAL